ncbi:MAG: cobalamin biosynthesis protein CobB [Micrococcales bacterium]|nr:cobalamin biosynthesis protein CobB [Micrococcales bacterium]
MSDSNTESCATKGKITLVHLYPREMSIYGDLGNTRALATRLRQHRYEVELIDHHPGQKLGAGAHLVVGGGGQDSGQARVEADLAVNGQILKTLAEDGTPMLMICGMYQLFGNDFTTVEGKRLPGLGILDVTTRGNEKRMIGPVVLRTKHGDVVGYENHSGSTTLGPGQQPFGAVRHGQGNNGSDQGEGAVRHHVYGSYLHGPLLPANPAVADALIKAAVDRALTRGFEPEELDDSLADETRTRQIGRLLLGRNRPR